MMATYFDDPALYELDTTPEPDYQASPLDAWDALSQDAQLAMSFAAIGYRWVLACLRHRTAWPELVRAGLAVEGVTMNGLTLYTFTDAGRALYAAYVANRLYRWMNKFNFNLDELSF